MKKTARVVTTTAELIESTQSPESPSLEVRGQLEATPTLRLWPGQELRGSAGASICFKPGDDGVIVTSDNVVEGVELHTDRERCALSNDRTTGGFGRLRLSSLRTTGCIRLIAEGAALGGHVEARNVSVVDADARNFDERPSGFGVEVISGTFTLWNRQASKDCRVSASLCGIAIGRAGLPVQGTGIVIAGTPGGGGVFVSVLETGDVYSDGCIVPGTADRISGGVFILQAADVDEVRNVGEVKTYGANDMVLDNWGRVERWHAFRNVTSYGPSGIGFVNLGQLGELIVDRLLETHGSGACGFNCGEVGGQDPDAGTVRRATFERVVTRGDGAIGIQVSVPAGRIVVRNGLETYGGVGASLARGVVTKLAAVALSLKPGGSAREVIIKGGLTTHGKGVEAIELHGQIDEFRISGSIGPAGGGFGGAQS